MAKKNLIAHNNAELARIMWQNRELAKKYLYADRIAEWLEDVDRPEVAMQIRDITEMRHPADRDTGLYAACMELDPSMPFTGIKGNPIRSQKGTCSRTLHPLQQLRQRPRYDGPCAVGILQRRGSGCRRKKYQRKSHPLKATYIRELAFLLDPSLPYPVPVVTDEKKRFVPVTTLDEYREAFYSSDIWDNSYQNDPDFIAWARHCDAALVGHGLKLMDEAKNIEDVFTNTLMHFCLLPDIGFDGEPLATSDMSNPEQIARVLAAELSKEAEGKEFWDVIDWKVFDGSKLHAYLYVRGGFDTQCDWVTYCMDTKSTDAQKRTGPYNPAIAELKILAGWNGGSIPVIIEGITFNTPDDVANADLSGFSDREQTFLANWLTPEISGEPAGRLFRQILHKAHPRILSVHPQTPPAVRLYRRCPRHRCGGGHWAQPEGMAYGAAAQGVCRSVLFHSNAVRMLTDGLSCGYQRQRHNNSTIQRPRARSRYHNRHNLRSHLC